MPHRSSAEQIDEVRDDRDVDREPAGFPDARSARELVELERDQERGRDGGQVLRPQLVEPEPHSFDELESAVGDGDDPGCQKLVCTQVVQAKNDVVEERSVRIELDGAHDSLGEPAVVGVDVSDEVDARAREHEAAQRPLDGDQA